MNLNYEPYAEKEDWTCTPLGNRDYNKYIEVKMTEKEVKSIEHLEYEDGSKIQGTDIQRVFNSQMMFKQKFGIDITVATTWKNILFDDAKARELKVCSTDNPDDCEACGS